MHDALKFLFAEDQEIKANMKVVGIGGAGGNAVDRMIRAGLSGLEFIAVNTDAQALEKSLATKKIQIGRQQTKGLGAGGDPEMGLSAAEADADTLKEVLHDSDLVFITAGMGGGTGTGAAPKIAEIALGMEALTVAIVTTPFLVEGKRRMANAEKGINAIRGNVDTLVTISNEHLLSVVDSETTLLNAFEKADSVLTQATRGISDLVAVPGIINLDFADVKAIMRGGGDALMGIGDADGENRAVRAAEQAISSSLLDDVNISGAEGVLVNITGSSEMKLHEVNAALKVVYDATGDNANVIFGAVVDDSLGDTLGVTVIATGFQKHGRSGHMTLGRQNGRDIKYRMPQKIDMDVPAIVRREAHSKQGNGSLKKTANSRIYLGEVDVNGNPPDEMDLPSFLGNSSH